MRPAIGAAASAFWALLFTSPIARVEGSAHPPARLGLQPRRLARRPAQLARPTSQEPTRTCRVESRCEMKSVERAQAVNRPPLAPARVIRLSSTPSISTSPHRASSRARRASRRAAVRSRRAIADSDLEIPKREHRPRPLDSRAPRPHARPAQRRPASGRPRNRDRGSARSRFLSSMIMLGRPGRPVDLDQLFGTDRPSSASSQAGCALRRSAPRVRRALQPGDGLPALGDDHDVPRPP